jgi:hypothetical protein
LDAFTVPTRLPGKGRWYRVLIGGFDSESGAIEAGQELGTNRPIGRALVHSLPYAIEVTGLARKALATGAVKAARDLGYLPRLRPDGGTPAAGSGRTMVVEAFGTPEETEHLTDRLRAEGLSPRVIRR